MQSPVSIGFWKNHLGPCGGGECVATYLPIDLGEPDATDCQVDSPEVVCSPGRRIAVDSTGEADIILDDAMANDASLRLGGDLLVTKLNMASGKGDASCLDDVVTAADRAITAYGYNTTPAGVARKTDLSLAMQLEYWNTHGVCLQ